MTNEEKIIEIDEFLQRCEDWMHGEDSKTVTRCRKLLFQLNDELDIITFELTEDEIIELDTAED